MSNIPKRNSVKQFNEDWSKYRETVSQISRNSQNDHSLIERDLEIFNFDKITQDLYKHKKVLASADGLYIKRNNIVLLEFKGGFKDKLTTKGIKTDESVKCYKTDEICENANELYKKKREIEKNDLKNSIFKKAITSYLTLDKYIIQKYFPDRKTNILFIAVVECIDPTDEIEYCFGDMGSSSKQDLKNSSNELKNLKTSLSVLTNHKDSENNSFLYNRIDVWSTNDCLNHIKEDTIIL